MRKIRTPLGHELEFDEETQTVTLASNTMSKITLDSTKAERKHADGGDDDRQAGRRHDQCGDQAHARGAGRRDQRRNADSPPKPGQRAFKAPAAAAS